MATKSKRVQRATERLEERRQRVERRLADVRTALDREVGWAPRARVWLVPLVAFACGLAFASARKRRSARDRSVD